MRRQTRAAWPAPLQALALALALAAVPHGGAWAMQQGRSLQGLPYVTGGVGETEQLAMQAQRPAYSLWVITAAMRTGEYLADARISIRDASGQLVFEDLLDGPWLLIELAQGRYEIEASWRGQIVRSTTTVHKGDQHQIVAYFKPAGER